MKLLFLPSVYYIQVVCLFHAPVYNLPDVAVFLFFHVAATLCLT